MHVIAGRFKGTPLCAAKSCTRPTTDRTKEAIFSRLDSWGVCGGARVLDLFAGTAALGVDAILEHHQYTRPTTWRGISVPAILTSGDHAKVDRFRRDDALERTSQIRPDLIEKLDCKSLSKQDRKTLISLGWEVSGDSPRRATTCRSA